jgi:pSer/pThr/pTyr-binding forkhead associated (FHA) protein
VRRLVVVDGAAAGTTVDLTDEPITIGRADDSTITLIDDYVSTRHARLVLQDGTWLIEDLGSTNGTYLDRQRVTALTPVTAGVPIRIGKTVLELRK